MDNEQTTKKFKRAIIILSTLLFGLGGYTIVLFQEGQANLIGLEDQKAAITQELEGIEDNYNNLISAYDLQDKQLIDARARILILLDSVKAARPSMAIIKRYRTEIARLKMERNMLFARADSLIQVTMNLNQMIDSTQTILAQTSRSNDVLSEQNKSLQEVLARGARLQALDLSSTAVIVRSSGKIVDTRRASRADKIRSCFSLAPNELARSGAHALRLQIINPKNNLLGERFEVKENDVSMFFSATSEIVYDQQEMDICVLVDAAQEDLIPGRYVVNLFDGSQMLASSAMYLK
jgi:cell division protein FtsB